MTWQVASTPDWAPLEKVLPPTACADYMHMGHTGTIQHYKHHDTRAYLNIDATTGEFFRYEDGAYHPVSREEAFGSALFSKKPTH